MEGHYLCGLLSEAYNKTANWHTINRGAIREVKIRRSLIVTGRQLFVTRRPKRSIIIARDKAFPANDADDGLVLPHIILHLLLHVSVVLEQVLQVFLAVGEV
jgi:hypothetical protein